MAAFKYKLQIIQGETLAKTFNWKAGSPTPTPVDLTGCTARMQIRSKVGAVAHLMELTTENGRIVLGGAAGTVQLNLTAAETSAINWVSGVYDLEIVYLDGRVRRLISGSVVVSPGVTR